jgi:hypothetical protein
MTEEIKVMNEAISAQIGKLRHAPFKELNKRYKKMFGKAETASHKTYLLRRIAYRLQELEHGGLSLKAKDSLKTLVTKYDPINNAAFRPAPSRLNASNSKDRRLPIPGTVINKEYKGSRYQVKVLENGFEYSSKIYTSLSAIAKEITGAHWNGYLFFGL